MSNAAAPQSAPGAWSPMIHRPFALLWIATLISNIGTWMHDVGAGWLMTNLAPSATIVALVQTATTLPIFTFALLAGVLADRFNKRSFLLLVNCLLFLVVSGFAVLAHLEMITPILLLVFTFLIGTGAAFLGPAWAAVVPALVPQEKLAPAVALNSLGINISRAIGPALAGFLITAVSLAAPFVANAASFLVIIGALVLWNPDKDEAAKQACAPKENHDRTSIWQDLKAGLDHVAHNPGLKATLWRAVGFFSFASAFWALLPLTARSLPDASAETYGLMLATIGAGAVAGALVMPKLRAIFSLSALAAIGTVVVAAAMVLMSLAHNLSPALIASALAGLGWISVLTAMQVSAQTSLPNWVRARGLSVFLMTFFGAMAAGSAIWGYVADHYGLLIAQSAAASCAIIAIALTWHWKLGLGQPE